MEEIKFIKEEDGWTRIERNFDDTQKLIDVCSELAKQHNDKSYEEKKPYGYRGRRTTKNTKNRSKTSKYIKKDEKSERKTRVERSKTAQPDTKSTKKPYDVESEKVQMPPMEVERKADVNKGQDNKDNRAAKSKSANKQNPKSEDKKKESKQPSEKINKKTSNAGKTKSQSNKLNLQKPYSGKNRVIENEDVESEYDYYERNDDENLNKTASIIGLILAIAILVAFGFGIVFFGNKVSESVETGTLVMWIVDAVIWAYEIFYGIVSWLFEIILNWFPL